MYIEYNADLRIVTFRSNRGDILEDVTLEEADKLLTDLAMRLRKEIIEVSPRT